MRDDGGGGHLALVLATVSPGSRPVHGHGHNTVVTSCDSQHHGHTGNNITMIVRCDTSPEHQAPVRAVLGVAGLVPQV